MQLSRCFLLIVIIVTLSIFISFSNAADYDITTETLLNDMVDMTHLADFPQHGYESIQYSSYDRRSQLPGTKSWFDNSDGFGSEPIPNFEKVLSAPDSTGVGRYLICDVKGPGAVVRIWTPALSENIEIYLDDMNKPLYAGPAKNFFKKPYETLITGSGLEEEIFKDSFQQRDAWYFPFAFAERFKIIWVGKLENIHFYQIQFKLYDKDTKVKSFTTNDFKEYAETIRRTAEILKDPDSNYKFKSKKEIKSITENLAAGEKKTLFDLQGPGAIEMFEVKVTAENMRDALRQSLLYVMCDDNFLGDIQCPIGDFFGAAPGINPYQSLPFTVKPDGTMICRFVMPFKKQCQIILENKSTEAIKIEARLLPVDYNWIDGKSMNFCAKWRVNHDLTGWPVQDLPFLIADGQGVYVGTASLMINPTQIATSGGGWWGEGDEKIFIDDDTRPSFFGTGSEDYYNYSWSAVDIFDFAYCAQPRNDGPGNRGFVTNNRWHISDAIAFNKHLAFYMELYPHGYVPGFTYARISYHYAMPGLRDDHVTITTEDIRSPKLPDNWLPKAEGGTSNSVFYQAEDIIETNQNVTIDKDNLWSAGKAIMWSPSDKNEEITFDFDIKDDGVYTIYIVAGFLDDAGNITARFQDQPVKLMGRDSFDLKAPNRKYAGNINISENQTLKKGIYKLKFKNVGPGNSKVAIDFFWLQKQKDVVKVTNAIEAEDMRVIAKSAGLTQKQDLSAYGNNFSNNAHLWWTDANIGDSLTLALDVENTCLYNLKMQLVKSYDYGIVQIYLDNKKIGNELDLFSDNVVATGAINLATINLTKGTHELKIEIMGSNEKAKKAYMCGIDYLLLTPVK